MKKPFLVKTMTVLLTLSIVSALALTVLLSAAVAATDTSGTSILPEPFERARRVAMEKGKYDRGIFTWQCVGGSLCYMPDSREGTIIMNVTDYTTGNIWSLYCYNEKTVFPRYHLSIGNWITGKRTVDALVLRSAKATVLAEVFMSILTILCGEEG